MPLYSPEGLAQYVPSNFTNKFPLDHVTQDDVSTSLQRLGVETITGYQTVRGRGMGIVVMPEMH